MTERLQMDIFLVSCVRVLKVVKERAKKRPSPREPFQPVDDIDYDKECKRQWFLSKIKINFFHSRRRQGGDDNE